MINPTATKKRKLKWWNNGWIGLSALSILFGVLFLIGKHSPEYKPNPIIEGRTLLAWINDLSSSRSLKASEVLKSHKVEVKPVLLQWLAETDSVPQKVYLGTMSMIEAKAIIKGKYNGAYLNHKAAADGLRVIGDPDPDILDALKRVADLYSDGYYTKSVTTRALNELIERQNVHSNDLQP